MRPAQIQINLTGIDLCAKWNFVDQAEKKCPMHKKESVLAPLNVYISPAGRSLIRSETSNETEIIDDACELQNKETREWRKAFSLQSAWNVVDADWYWPITQIGWGCNSRSREVLNDHLAAKGHGSIQYKDDRKKGKKRSCWRFLAGWSK